MRKLLLFTLAAFIGLNAFAQPSVGWESHWSGYTTDSRGVKWITILNDTNQDVAWTVAFDGSGNGDDVYAVGVTTDGGVTWNTFDPVSLENAINMGISMVFPTDANTAYIAAFNGGQGSIGDQGLWKTTDGGNTWLRINTNTMYSDATSFPNLIYFFDANNGFAQGDPVGGEFEMYLTSDAGATWTPIDGANIDDPLPGEFGYTNGYAAAGNTVWFTTNMGRIFRSTDQGQTWQAFDTPLNDFGGQNNDSGELVFKDNNEGWILRGNAELYHTADGGATWTLMSPNGKGDYAGDIAYVPGIDALIVTEADASLTDYGTKISYDGGLNWEKIVYYKFEALGVYDNIQNIFTDGNVQHLGIAFRDENFGLSGGFSQQNNPDLGGLGIFVFKNNPDIGAVNTEKIEGLQVYPNPANSFVNVAAENNIQNISIVDITGKEVFSQANIALNNTTINISNLEKGIYLMKVMDENNAQQTIKLVVK